MFPTEYGVASLTLREIPYREDAYIHVQDVQPGRMKELLEECGRFCRACGAESIFAGGVGDFSDFSYHGSVIKMTLALTENSKPRANLWPVTEQTVGMFRSIYNSAMARVDYAGTLTSKQEQEIINSCGTYFVHRDGTLLGLGWMEGEVLKAIVSVVPGAGEVVAQTLFTTVNTDRIRLEVASTNHRAIRLYEKLGFIQTGEAMRWHRVDMEYFTKI